MQARRRRRDRGCWLRALAPRWAAELMDTHKGLFPLHQAAAVGDAPAIRSCLAGGSPPHIDTRNRRGNTALMLAAETGQVEALRALLAAGANPLLYNTQRHIARDFWEKHIARRGAPPTASEAEIQTMLTEAERTAEANGVVGAGPSVTGQGFEAEEKQQGLDTPTLTPRKRAEDPSAAGGGGGQESMRHCPVCGVAVRRRLKIDFLQEEDEKGVAGTGECSLHVTTALHSDALRTMREHPDLHYHNLLEMRSLRKEISESWGALAATRSMLAELNMDPADVRVALRAPFISSFESRYVCLQPAFIDHRLSEDSHKVKAVEKGRSHSRSLSLSLRFLLCMRCCIAGGVLRSMLWQGDDRSRPSDDLPPVNGSGARYHLQQMPPPH
jgi:hypothetical protein